MAMDERGLGKRLQKARQEAGLTQQQLCQRANLSFSTLTKIERGAIKAPSIFTIQAIASAVNLSLDELVGNAATRTPARQLHKTKSGASFIYFDMNGCLVHFFQGAFAALSAATGAPADSVEAVYWHYNDDVCRGAMSLDDFNAKLSERLGVDSIKWQQYYLEAVEPIQEMHDLIKWAAEHYKVGLLTNTMPGLVEAMKRQSLIPDIPYDAVIDSSEVGAIKPEIKIYEAATEQAGCPSEEILLIDDSRANLMAAEKQGWHVLWFDDARPDVSAASVREALQPAG
jgi:HAD superfamily hydrolase (TIGR01509 family)